MIPLSLKVLGSLFGLSELLLALLKRSKAGSVSKDRGSLWRLWAVILASIGLANGSALLVPEFYSAWLHTIRFAGVALVVAGLLLRWCAIIHLGRFRSEERRVGKEGRS